MKKLHLAPSELCSDETFLRRVSLDLIGLPPTREDYDRFLADSNDPLVVGRRENLSKLLDALEPGRDRAALAGDLRRWATDLSIQTDGARR